MRQRFTQKTKKQNAELGILSGTTSSTLFYAGYTFDNKPLHLG